jgi:putative ABC transport system substrate-binding protein
MKRREFIMVAGAAASWPLAAHAQQRPVIGFLGNATITAWADRLRAFERGLLESGFVDGRNVKIEYRWAEGHNDRLPGLAEELSRLRVAAIVVLGNTPSALAAKAATGTIPIIFRVAADPVEVGLVSSLNRPGGNLTGVTTLGVEAGQKQLELLHLIVPTVKTIGLLVNPANPVLAEHQTHQLPVAARALGVELTIVNASSDRDLASVFAVLKVRQAGGLLIGADSFLNSRNEQLAALATDHALPTIAPYREFASAGGLMSYGGSIAEASRLAGIYTGRILNGERPADLPVQQVTKLEMVINLKAAKSLGLDISATLLARADEVIE